MLPAGPLMIEHRLIEKMIGILKTGEPLIRQSGRLNPSFVEKTVDFFRIYADRTHHGKEEDILFKKLSEKQMRRDLKEIMEELIREHAFARSKVKALEEAAGRFQKDPQALQEVLENLKTLTSFYPAHIEKEDKRFFLPVMDYLTDEEKNRMMADFEAFDRAMIHEKYGRVVETFPSPTP
ncbi:MAG: hemerythrin domain-containing protein [Candidatus Omnitrophota bacterium]